MKLYHWYHPILSHHNDIISYRGVVEGLTLPVLNYKILILTHLTLCLATAIHNFKLVKIIHVYLICEQV